MRTWEITEFEQARCYIIDTPQLRKALKKQIKANGGTIVKVAGLTIILISVPQVAFASSGFDHNAWMLYKKLIGIGKWIIIFKGGIEAIKAVADNDMDKAKKGFFGHLIMFGLLYALPWGMTEIESLFNESNPVEGGQ